MHEQRWKYIKPEFQSFGRLKPRLNLWPRIQWRPRNQIMQIPVLHFPLFSLLSLCTLTSSYPTIPTSGVEETNVGRGRWRGFCHCFRFSFVLNAAAQGIRFPKMFPSKTSFYRRLPFLNNCSFHPFSHPKENCKMHRTIYGGDYQIRLIGSHWFARQFLLCNKLHQLYSLKMYLYSIDPRPGILIQDQIFQSNRAENWPIWESTYRLDNSCSL